MPRSLYPNRRLPDREQLVVAIAYVNALLILGLGSATVFDPQAGGCTECPSNLLLVEGSSRIWDGLNRLGVYVGFGWSVAAGLIIALRLARSSPGGRSSLWPMLVPAAVYLGLVALAFADSLERGALGTSTRQRDLWLGQALALVAIAAGVAWTWIRARYRRAEVARLVIEIAESPVPGELRARLGRMLGDPSLAIGYPLADGRLVDADGRAIVLEGDVTPLIRGGETLALLSHRRWAPQRSGTRRGGRARRSPGARARTTAGGGSSGARRAAEVAKPCGRRGRRQSGTGSSVTSTTARSSGSPPSRSALAAPFD